jgi:hypothetical protein
MEEICEDLIYPEGTAEYECSLRNLLDQAPVWSEPGVSKWSKCWCTNKALLKKFWDCYYTRASRCFPIDDKAADWIWYEETDMHRYWRRLYCLDDYKPDLPWDKLSSWFVQYVEENSLYNNQSEYQYAWDFS